MIIDKKPDIYTVDDILETIELEKRNGLDDGIILVDAEKILLTIKYYEKLFKLTQEEGSVV